MPPSVFESRIDRRSNCGEKKTDGSSPSLSGQALYQTSWSVEQHTPAIAGEKGNIVYQGT